MLGCINGTKNILKYHTWLWLKRSRVTMWSTLWAHLFANTCFRGRPNTKHFCLVTTPFHMKANSINSDWQTSLSSYRRPRCVRQPHLILLRIKTYNQRDMHCLNIELNLTSRHIPSRVADYQRCFFRLLCITLHPAPSFMMFIRMCSQWVLTVGAHICKLC